MRMRGRRRTIAWLSLTAIAGGALAGGCGDDTPSPPIPGALQLDSRPATPAEWTDTAVISPDVADAIGVDAEGRVWAVLDGRVFVVDSGVLAVRQRFADPAPSDPATTETTTTTGLGVVHRIRPRLTGGAWLATETGLWTTEGLYVRRRPTNFMPPGITDVQDVAAGDFAGLWLAARDGVYHVFNDQVRRFEADRPARRLAVNGFDAALVDGTTVRLLTAEPDGVYVREVPFNHRVVDVVASEDALYVATDGGLFRYRGSEWTRFDAIGAVQAINAQGGEVWARTADGTYVVSDTRLSQYPPVSGTALAVDRLGDVWTTASQGLVRASTGIVSGEVATFARDVQPWIDTHCAACHSNQTQDFRAYETFREVAADALTRVRSGDMPRCAGGVRCSPEAILTDDDYSVLERWIRAGTPE